MELAKNNFGSKNNAEGFLCIASRKYPEVDQSVNLGANQKEIIIVEYESFLDISNSFDFREAVKTSIKTGNCHEDMKRHLLEFYNLLEGLHERDTIMTDVFDIILIQYNMHERERVLWFFNEKNILYDFIHGQDKIVVESHCRRRWYDLASQHDRKHSQAFVSQVVDVQDFDVRSTCEMVPKRIDSLPVLRSWITPNGVHTS